MPEGHEIDLARRLVVSRAWGVLSTSEFLAHYQAVAADPDFDPTFAQLMDLRDLTPERERSPRRANNRPISCSSNRGSRSR